MESHQLALEASRGVVEEPNYARAILQQWEEDETGTIEQESTPKLLRHGALEDSAHFQDNVEAAITSPITTPRDACNYVHHPMRLIIEPMIPKFKT